MSARMNGIPMSISVGERSTLEETFAMGDRFCRRTFGNGYAKQLAQTCSKPTVHRERKQQGYRITTQAERDGIVAAYLARKPLAQIARDYGRERSTVWNVLVKAGVYVPVYLVRGGAKVASKGGPA